MTKFKVDLFLFLLFLVIANLHLNAQTFDVSGTITTSTMPVQNASITFIDNSDTTRQFSTVTNNAGEYSLRIITLVTQNEIQPRDFELAQNYPNPFSSLTAISFKLDKPSDVLITIFDVLGREIIKYPMGSTPAGEHQLSWDGLNHLGENVAPGVYFYQLQTADATRVKKMILSKSAGQIVSSRLQTNFQPLRKDRLATEFTVLIENTSTTLPSIVPKQIDNIRIQSDQVLDFAVTEFVSDDAATIYLDSTQQIISGFGAANILQWRPDMTTDQIDKAFGINDGHVGLTILRLRIPPGANNFAVNVRTARAAYERGVKIIASPWSPPANMKTNNSLVGGRLREDSYADYAAHLKSFADFMADNGVPLHALSIQNEPDVSVDYESCDWNAAELLKFVKENAPAIGTDIIVPESFQFNHDLSDPILNDPEAAEHVSIIGGHIYGGGLRSYPLAKSTGKELWMTEHLDTDTTWSHVLATGKEINDCMNAGMNAYIWWYIVRFYGPIGEDGEVTKRGYVMSQFARFIRPGFFRIFTTRIPQSRVHVSGYRDENKVVIVAINQRSQTREQTFVLKNGSTASFTPYVTSETENCVQKNTVKTVNGVFHATLAPSSITTFVSE